MEVQSNLTGSYLCADAELDFGDGVVWLALNVSGYVLRQIANVEGVWYWADSNDHSSNLFMLADQPQSIKDIPNYKFISHEEFELVWDKAHQ